LTSASVSPAYSTIKSESGVPWTKAEPARLLDVAAREIQDHFVGGLHGVGMRLQNQLRALQSFDVVVEVNYIHRCPFGLGHETHLGFDYGCQSALGPDDHTGKIEWLRFDEFVQIVAGDAPHDFRITRENFVFVLLRETEHFATGAALDRIGAAPFFDFLRQQIFQHDFAAVGEQDRQLDDMIEGFTVCERMGSRRIVADHAADGGAIGCRSVGTEL
jgi:hypothetical protein